MYDAIVLGYGPAGAQAAIYLLRAGLKTLIIGRDGGSLAKASKIDNFYGQSEPPSGEQLIKAGLSQINSLGGDIINDEITSIGFGDGFAVKTPSSEFSAKAVLIATGRERKKASVAGIESYEGRGVSYCAVCDGFFYKGKTVAVLGEGEYALSEALELSHVASSVVILTNGRPANFTPEKGILVDTRKVLGITGQEVVEGVAFEGETLPVNGLFVAEGSASGLDFAKKLGLAVKDGALVVDERQQTNMPGIFAAGDCTGGVLQVAVAAGEGAKAALAMTEFIRKAK